MIENCVSSASQLARVVCSSVFQFNGWFDHTLHSLKVYIYIWTSMLSLEKHYTRRIFFVLFCLTCSRNSQLLDVLVINPQRACARGLQ